MSPQTHTLHVEVCVIGAGLVGSSTALHLARYGVAVALVERDKVGAHASGVNFGGVRRHGRAAQELPLAALSHEIWQHLRHTVGDDCGYRQCGHLKLAFQDNDMAMLEGWSFLGREHGIETEMLDRKALRARFDWIGPRAAGASWCPSDGQANPRLLAPAFARQAGRLGAVVIEGAPVSQLRHDGKHFQIRAGDHWISARQVVNSAGAWGHHIARHVGDVIALEQVAPQMYVTEPVAYRIHPAIGMAAGRIYLRQTPRGNVIFGGKRGIVSDDALHSRPTIAHMAETLRVAVDVAPMLASATVIRSWTGIEGYPVDGLPVIDESPCQPGLFHAFGFSGHGFQIAPGVGKALAHWLHTGTSPRVLAHLGLSRFRNPRPAPPTETQSPNAENRSK